MNNKIYILTLLAGCFLAGACKKFIEVERGKDMVDADIVFQDEGTANSAVIGMYSDFVTGSATFGSYAGLGGMTGYGGDELTVNVPTPFQAEIINNAVSPENGFLLWQWNGPYKTIYMANSIIEGMEHATNVSPENISRFRGEAYLMRAICHFNLTNMFKDVPLILTTDYRQNIIASKTTQEKVYEQIISDLLQAKADLPEGLVDGKRFRANKDMATAMLARMYLYTEDWENAEMLSSAIINNPNYALSNDLNGIFQLNSMEMIWQFASVSGYTNTPEVYELYKIPTTESILRESLVNSFEPGDKRRADWVASYSESGNTWYRPYKYKVSEPYAPISEYTAMFRLAEQYLIRAEARIHLDNIEEAIADLNFLRSKRRLEPTAAVPNPLPDLSPAMSEAAALLAVEEERKHELFVEVGHRWFDLRRTGRADAVYGALKGNKWQSSDIYFPIPESERRKNPNL